MAWAPALGDGDALRSVFMPGVKALWRLGQDDCCELKVSLDYSEL